MELQLSGRILVLHTWHPKFNPPLPHEATSNGTWEIADWMRVLGSTSVSQEHT